MMQGDTQEMSNCADYSVNRLYADNKVCLVVMQISLSPELWAKFEESPIYQQITSYVDALQI